MISVTMMADDANTSDFNVASCSSGSSSLRWRITNSTRHTAPTTMTAMTIGFVQPKLDALEKP
ncbi:MAG: hypothetical protein KH142_10305 [Slackia piriformis]|uniref:Uncharacterized protein n=1 Tax=Slackia piriformis TaxID=626934 RepID=A0A943V2C0_9ACTN|nr:hypothetical protein [Slackia piriformis]